MTSRHAPGIGRSGRARWRSCSDLPWYATNGDAQTRHCGGRTMNPARCITSAFVIALMIFCGTAPISLAQQGKSREGTALALDPQSEIRLAAPWTLSAVEYRNAKEVVVM